MQVNGHFENFHRGKLTEVEDSVQLDLLIQVACFVTYFQY
jgi:hypothetical protein